MLAGARHASRGAVQPARKGGRLCLGWAAGCHNQLMARRGVGARRDRLLALPRQGGDDRRGAGRRAQNPHRRLHHWTAGAPHAPTPRHAPARLGLLLYRSLSLSRTHTHTHCTRWITLTPAHYQTPDPAAAPHLSAIFAKLAKCHAIQVFSRRDHIPWQRTCSM